MGRGRLRRGCSLEVIFEEDPDFCSYLESLDGGVAIRFGIKEPDDTISLDSLLEVEEYQVRFEDPADAEQVFRSLDGFIDVRSMDSCMVEWDEFSMDSNGDDTGNVTTEKDSLLESSEPMGTGSTTESEKIPSGRRSRVSRRQIIQATWLGYSSSSDESLTNNDPDDIDKNNNSSAAGSAASNNRPQRRRSPTNRHHQKVKLGNVTETERKSDNDGSSEEPTSISKSPTSSPKCKISAFVASGGGGGSVGKDDGMPVPSSSFITRGSPNLVTSVEDFPGNDESKKDGGVTTLKTPIQLHLRASPNPSNNVPHGIFGRVLTDTIDIIEKDTLDSYISTMTDETDANAYTFADPFDDTHSVASTSYESSGSTSSTESNGSSVCTVNSFSMKNGKGKSNGIEGKTGSSGNNAAGFSHGISNDSSSSNNDSCGSKYKSNLKVELVSQLNKSQNGTVPLDPAMLSPANSTISNSSTLTGLPQAPTTTALQLDVESASNSATVNPASHLYSTNSNLNFESSPISSQTGPISLKLSPHQHRQQHPLVSIDHERQSLSGDVKRVRALFELRNHSNGNGSGSGGSTCPSSPESTSSRNGSGNGVAIVPPSSSAGADINSLCGGNASSRRVGLYSKNGRRARGSPPSSRSSASPSKVLKTTFNSNSPIPMSSGNGGNNNSRGSPNGTGNNPNYDFEDVLVNESIVIEDSPDLFQVTRSRRNGNFDRDSVPSPPISNKRPITIMNLSPGDGTSSPSSKGVATTVTAITSSTSPSLSSAAGGSLRRSQSMGTGISSLGSPSTSSYGVGILKQTSSKTNILAEELPAPDTVKNVRNVFENMLKMRGKRNNHGGSENSVDTADSINTSNIITPSSFSGSFSIVKKSLSYIKSNPTSKIYRSESMRDDFPSMSSSSGRRYGKPVLLSEQNSPVHSPNYPSSHFVGGGQVIPSLSSSPNSSVAETSSARVRCGASASTGADVPDGVRNKRSSSVSPTNKNAIERRISSTAADPAKFSLKINTGLSPSSSVPPMLRSSASCHVPLTEEDPSFSSNVSNTEDYRTRKYVHSDVLQKIRSAGTTTTYFGGKIVAKTVKNRKIPVSRRHTFDFQDYVGISGEGTSFSNYEPSYSSHNSSSTNYFYHPHRTANDENRESKCFGPSSAYFERRDNMRPALEIPLKSSTSSNIYASRGGSGNTTTISSALDSIFASGVGAGLLTFASKPIDTTPRIISVLHKSPPGSQTGSPVKSCSPVSSVIDEGRNSPEGCEATNEKMSVEVLEQDGNNNNLPGKVEEEEEKSPSTRVESNCTTTGESEGFSKKFSQITEGAWF